MLTVLLDVLVITFYNQCPITNIFSKVLQY